MVSDSHLSATTPPPSFYSLCYLWIQLGLVDSRNPIHCSMDNWQLLMAAFVLSLVDLGVLSAFLWYQLSTMYFAWHLCPMIVNRICEIIAFLFTGGMLPNLFSIVQVPLSLFSTSVYANRQQHLENKLLLAVYCTLLVYEFLVAVLMIKMGRYTKYPAHSIAPQILSSTSQQVPRPYSAFQMFASCTQHTITNSELGTNVGPHKGSQAGDVVTVQQPGGKKVMLGKVLPSRLEEPEKLVIDIQDGSQKKRVSDVTSTVTHLCITSALASESGQRTMISNELV